MLDNYETGQEIYAFNYSNHIALRDPLIELKVISKKISYKSQRNIFICDKEFISTVYELKDQFDTSHTLSFSPNKGRYILDNENLKLYKSKEDAYKTKAKILTRIFEANKYLFENSFDLVNQIN